ncbi:MAG: ATP-binding cassette domain-containing protein [Bdellovibrionales bacterium]|nr:ATP-binding cassette domain-containing protein [Bdellovibrionales bacterium]
MYTRMNLLEVRHLKKYFTQSSIWTRSQVPTKAVDDVSFSIETGSTIGLVGESGCGKTTMGRMILNLLNPTSGDILFNNASIFSMDRDKVLEFRQKVQAIFQDPFGSLNPRKSVFHILKEGLDIHKIKPETSIKEYIENLMTLVGLNPKHLKRLPHEFSGGQRQRIGIARALSVNPIFIVADEPISALDVSIQAQIVNLLMDLRDQRNLTYLFISHDLKIVEYLCVSVIVMYLGHIMEIVPAKELFRRALHPYTKALVSAMPHFVPLIDGQRTILPGEIPSPMNPPTGCVFHTRGPVAESRCSKEIPAEKRISDIHTVACHLI